MAKITDEKNKQDQDKKMDTGSKIGLIAAISLLVAGIGWGLNKILKNTRGKKE